MAAVPSRKLLHKPYGEEDLSNVWFDRYKISRDCLEHLESIDAMANSLGAVIQEVVRAGVPKHRRIIEELDLAFKRGWSWAVDRDVTGAAARADGDLTLKKV